MISDAFGAGNAVSQKLGDGRAGAGGQRGQHPNAAAHVLGVLNPRCTVHPSLQERPCLGALFCFRYHAQFGFSLGMVLLLCLV